MIAVYDPESGRYEPVGYGMDSNGTVYATIGGVPVGQQNNSRLRPLPPVIDPGTGIPVSSGVNSGRVLVTGAPPVAVIAGAAPPVNSVLPLLALGVLAYLLLKHK